MPSWIFNLGNFWVTSSIRERWGYERGYKKYMDIKGKHCWGLKR